MGAQWLRGLAGYRVGRTGFPIAAAKIWNMCDIYAMTIGKPMAFDYVTLRRAR
jgi:hypothetical protein